METTPIRLVILEPVQLQAHLWKSNLEEQPDIHSVTLSETLSEALEAARSCNVALVGTSFEPAQALRHVRELAISNPDLKVLVGGVSRAEGDVIRAVEAGASGLILKDETVQDALDSMRAAVQGGARIPPDLAPSLIDHLAKLKSNYIDPDVNGERYELLTPREKEVLDLITRGMTNKQIGDHLTIEVGTVKNHVHNLLGKLQARTRHEAADYLRSLRPEQVRNTAGQRNGRHPSSLTEPNRPDRSMTV